MKGRQITFFSINEDLHPVLEKLEATHPVSYAEMGSFETDHSPRYSKFSQIPNLGFTDSGDWSALGNRLLVFPKDYKVIKRAVRQRDGTLRYITDPMENPLSFELSIKGIYSKKPNVIIASRAAMASNDIWPVTVNNLFCAGLKARFRGINNIYIGPSAEEKLRANWRLVLIESSPITNDLKYS